MENQINVNPTVSGIEARKRFYEYSSLDAEPYQPRRGFFSSLYQLIFHPIKFFTPTEKKVGEVKLEIYQRNDGDVSLKLKEDNSNRTTHQAVLTETTDYQKEINLINDNLKLLLQNIIKNTSVAPIIIKTDSSILKENTILKLDEKNNSIIVEEPTGKDSILCTPSKVRNTVA
ncbi:hypothetical protein ENUP19_0121G0221 [Entamoeba nuttalli]|uniref:Uncharacterized protein n=2 Tax=Entamoeba nuttalli TaxID=412467 RepID=K2GUD3_ENTNP|nr:hypothetical protein ENU1_196100 [Entamoeba nuttalli P19]EKE37477.1 hypothetical protein ENU1_196100 [Entamoeba nuttalli P19]|eukprot:XP_008860181.1 hypothetical protein ENU1_196100 [Entamoeba nuttalli P19]